MITSKNDSNISTVLEKNHSHELGQEHCEEYDSDEEVFNSKAQRDVAVMT